MKVLRAVDGRVLILCSLLAALVPGYLFWSSSHRQDQLAMARDQLRCLFEAPVPDVRASSAHTCLNLVLPLTDGDDSISVTARLFAHGVAPLAEFESSSLTFPDQTQIQLVLTEDLVYAAKLLFHTGQFGRADQIIEGALLRHDNFRIDVLRLAGVIRFDLGRDEDVIAHCDELISLIPGDPQPHRVKSMVHRNHDQWELFIDSALQAASLSRIPDVDLHLELTDGYLQLGQAKDARRELDQLLEVAPNLAAEIPLVRARLLLQEGEHEQCEKILRQFLVTQPEYPEALILTGTLLVSKGQFAEGIKYLRKALDAVPADEQAHYQIGQAYARLGERQSAATHLKLHRAILDQKVHLHKLELHASREPGNVQVRRQLALIYSGLGLSELAEFWTRAADAAARQ
jgi:tetratricopeptide (TPR) repeat protein